MTALVADALAHVLACVEHPDEKTLDDVAQWAAQSPHHLYHLMTQVALLAALADLPPTEHTVEELIATAREAFAKDAEETQR